VQGAPKMTAGSKNVVLLALNVALSDRIIHADRRAYDGIADGVCSGEEEKRIPRIEAPSK
jgi:hypothetical protein